jgi:hypothetical protein
MTDWVMSNTDKHYVSEDESAGYASPVLDIIAALAISAMSVWIMIESLLLKVPGAVTTAPGLLPFVTAGMLLIMAIVLGVAAVRRLRSEPAGIALDVPEGLPRTGLLIAILIVYVSALEVLEFSTDAELGPFNLQITAFEPISIVVLTTILRIFWTPRLWPCLLVAILWISFLSFAFQSLMKIPMPG